MSDAQPGQIITFYSYKGGTGRTMALANVAWILASAGHRVLAVDWDIEAPGLPRFYQPFLRLDPALSPGVIDLVRTFIAECSQNRAAQDDLPSTAGLHDAEPDPHFDTARIPDLARVDDYAFSVNWAFEDNGSLSLLTAGLQDDQYSPTLGSLNWDRFYEKFHGIKFFDALRDNMKANYDYVLIDSRTGFSDVADVCTQRLPDVLVDCFTLSDQGIQGAARVAGAVADYSLAHGQDDGPDHAIRILPVAMRVDPFERTKVEAGRALAMRSFPNLPAGLSPEARAAYFVDVEIPYRTFYAYEETLATFERPGPADLLSAYERLTKVITEDRVSAMRPMAENLRLQWFDRFQRPLRTGAAPVLIDYAAGDQVWAEWIISVLEEAGVQVMDPGPIDLAAADAQRPPADLDQAATPDILSVVSGNLISARALGRTRRADVAVYVADARLPEHPHAATHLNGVRDGGQAGRLLLGALGRSIQDEVRANVRYPGTAPERFSGPQPTAQFTGRTTDLIQLRSRLRSSSGPAVVLQGMSGVGKTYVAAEYVRRFASAYDLVWWIQADPPAFVDTALTKLGDGLGITYEAGDAEVFALAVLEALRKGKGGRWLLVFDSANDVKQVSRYVPASHPDGHVLITSWNNDWDNDGYATPQRVESFPRADSTDYLRTRARGLTLEEADEVAEALDDLPLTVVANAALLATSAITPAELVREIRQGEATSLDARLERSFAPTLDHLRRNSPGGYRLLEVLSVMGPRTARDVATSTAMANAIQPVDASVSDRMRSSALIQEVSKHDLVRNERDARQHLHLIVHQVTQQVVRARMKEVELDERRHQAHLVLSGSHPEGEPDDPAFFDAYENIWRHLDTCRAYLCHDEDVRQLYVDRVRYLWSRGDLERGLRVGTEVAVAWEAVLNGSRAPQDPAVCVAAGAGQEARALRQKLLLLQFNMANILREQARFADAFRLDQQVHEEQVRLIGTEHWQTLLTAGGLAADRLALGHYRQALEESTQTYQSWLSIYGNDHLRTLAAANNLADSLRLTGDFRRATELDTEVLAARRQSLGPTHPLTLHSASALGRDLREAGEYERSIEVIQEALEQRGQASWPGEIPPVVVGSDRTTLIALANMATSVRAVGQARRAEPVLDAVHAQLADRFGPKAPDTLATRINRAANLLALDHPEAALLELEDLYQIYVSWLGPDHFLTLICSGNRSAALRSLGQRPEAREIARSVLTAAHDLLGGNHPFVMACSANQLICEFEASDRHPGEDLMAQFQQLTQRMRSVLGPGHPDTLAAEVNLGLVTTSGADRRAAQASIGRLADRLGPGHPAVTAARSGNLVYRVTDPPDLY